MVYLENLIFMVTGLVQKSLMVTGLETPLEPLMVRAVQFNIQKLSLYEFEVSNSNVPNVHLNFSEFSYFPVRIKCFPGQIFQFTMPIKFGSSMSSYTLKTLFAEYRKIII